MRNRICWIIIGLCLTLAVGAQQTAWTKMSPLVRKVAQVRRPAVSRSQGISPSPVARMTAFLRIDASQMDAVLERYGCRKYAQWGDICIADIPLDALAPLSKETAVSRIEANQRASVLMDTTTRVTNILPVYEQTTEHQAYTGRDVVVGVMDVGFDLTHPSFYDTTGSVYRIGAFWDQLLKAEEDSDLPVGRSFIGEEAVLANGHSLDGDSQAHGTHTLGIAAGSGYGSPYRGVAYESNLCVVSNAVSSDIKYIDPEDLYKYTSATDALGFKYLFDYADEVGQPCVASFSEGYSPYLDSEDSLYAAVLDSLSGPGHILVASAGNEGLSMTYVDKPVGTQAAGAFISTTKSQALYRMKADGEMTLKFCLYQGTIGTPSHTLTFSSTDERIEEGIPDTIFINKDTCAVYVVGYDSWFMAEKVYQIEVVSNKVLSSWGPIALVVEGETSHVELFGSSTYALTTRTTDTRWNAAQKGHNILAPGCFAPVICVGATAYREKIKNYKGNWIGSLGNKEGLITTYSSTGPASNGLMKPDVTAPGSNIVSAYSAYYLEKNPSRDGDIIAFSDFHDKSYPWSLNSGTSMSTPVVAGTIALWLQANPKLTPDDVRAILSSSCRHPEEALEYPNNQYGRGEIDGYKGLLEVLKVTSIEGVSTYQAEGVMVTPCEGGLRLLFDEQPSSPVRVRIFALSGTLLADTQVRAQSAFVAFRPAAHTVYVVQMDSDMQDLRGSRLVRF